MHLLKVGRGDPFSPASVSLKYSTMYETKYYNAHGDCDDCDDADANYVVVRVMTNICYRWTNRMDGGDTLFTDKTTSSNNRSNNTARRYQVR